MQKPTFIAIVQGVRLSNMVKLHIFCSPVLFFYFLSRPFSGTRRSICQAYASNDVVRHKEVPLGGFNEKFFQGSTPAAEISERILHQIEKSNNF
jgi:hypothetical protein